MKLPHSPILGSIGMLGKTRHSRAGGEKMAKSVAKIWQEKWKGEKREETRFNIFLSCEM